MTASTTTAEAENLQEKISREIVDTIWKTRDEAVLTFEGIALQSGLIPVTLLRESCTPDAEKVARKLGRMPKTAEPWLPVASVGPILIMAHHNPEAGDMWGVPLALTIRVLISIDQYSRTRQDLVQRFSTPPLPAQNPIESLKVPSFRAMDLDGIFQWLLQNYPYEPSEITKLKAYYDAAKEKKDKLTVADFNGMGRNFGVALARLQSDGKAHAYNAAEAPRQTMFPAHIIERHNVYPLFVGKNTVYLLSDTPDNFAFEDEWISLGN
ncbi:MAG: hypothetical protein K8R87_09770, partial [Verrucomicrobia bacterium]|nr:hypothetical protein [Verrucomicrobiota bacterium]